LSLWSSLGWHMPLKKTNLEGTEEEVLVEKVDTEVDSAGEGTAQLLTQQWPAVLGQQELTVLTLLHFWFILYHSCILVWWDGIWLRILRFLVATNKRSSARTKKNIFNHKKYHDVKRIIGCYFIFSGSCSRWSHHCQCLQRIVFHPSDTNHPIQGATPRMWKVFLLPCSNYRNQVKNFLYLWNVIKMICSPKNSLEAAACFWQTLLLLRTVVKSNQLWLPLL